MQRKQFCVKKRREESSEAEQSSGESRRLASVHQVDAVTVGGVQLVGVRVEVAEIR